MTFRSFYCGFFSLTVTALALALGGCKTQRSAEGDATTAAARETSVRPGVNDSYLQEDIDVGQWIERFEREGREVYDQRQAIVEAAQVKPGSDVADVGAGTGLFTMLLADQTGPSGTVFAVDIVEEFLSHVDRRAAEAGAENVFTVLASENSIELPEDSIDLAFICDAYHHFEYPQSTLASIQHALRPGGELVIVEFKRIPGESSEWAINHVRAGQEDFTAEIESAGFEKIEEIEGILEDNYILRFRSTR